MSIETYKEKPFKLTRRNKIFLEYFLSGIVQTPDIAYDLNQRQYTTESEVGYMIESLRRKVKKHFLPEFEGDMTKLRVLKILRIRGIVNDQMIKNRPFPVKLNPCNLYPREREVVFLDSEGLTAKQIASTLLLQEKMDSKTISSKLETANTISHRTVGSYLTRVAEVLESTNSQTGADYSYLTTSNPTDLTSLAFIRSTKSPIVPGEAFVPPLFIMPDAYRRYYYYSYLYKQVVDTQSPMYTT